MPIYEYKCECGRGKEAILSYEENGKPQVCACGLVMQRKVSLPAPAIIPMTGKDKVLKVLNKEDGFGFPGKGDKHRKRYEQSFSQGLDPPRPTIGKGF